MKKEKFKNYNLKTNQEVIDFAINDISESLYYIDSDGESWTGSNLKKCILNSSYDYDVFFGEIKEIEPYYFFLVEEQNISYDINRYSSSILYDGDSWGWDICENEAEAISSMLGCWGHLTSNEKNRKIVVIYKCFGIQEHSECINAADIVGFAAKLNGREYISESFDDLDVIFSIDSILQNDLDSEKIIECEKSFYYQDSVKDCIFRAQIEEQQYKLWGEIFLDNIVEIFKSK